MPRSKNPELQACLESILLKSLVTKGLDATSYQSVAEEASISRALVQYYYPRKMDFAVGFLNRILSTIADMLGITEYDNDAQLSYMEAYRMGSLYYSYLLSEDGGRRLFYDILKNRELSDELMREHYEWGMKRLDPNRHGFESRPQSIIEAWGGFYELMYYSIKQDFEIDIPMKVRGMLEVFRRAGAAPFESIGDGDDTRLDARLLEELKARLSEVASSRASRGTTLRASA